eukprot:scaffold325985_cov61-Tisochrysis_lutea.AAC.4
MSLCTKPKPRPAVAFPASTTANLAATCCGVLVMKRAKGAPWLWAWRERQASAWRQQPASPRFAVRLGLGGREERIGN